MPGDSVPKTSVRFVGSTLLALAVSCTPDAGPGRQWRLADTAAPALHAVQGSRLVATMRSLNEIALERLPQELQLSGERERRMEQASRDAEAIAEAARSLPEAADELALDAAERRLFLGLADKLRVQAQHLGHEAASGRYGRMEAEYEGLLATCNACHTAFRLPTVKGG